MRKAVISLIIFLFLFVGKAEAFEKYSFVTVANPVYGPENWTLSNQSPLDLPILQYSEATPSGMPVSWMLRFDAVTDATMSAYFQKIVKLDNTQDLGALLEVTPLLAAASGVNYPSVGLSPLSANRIFLSGYYPTDRVRLIDTYMDVFRKRFGFLPKSVSASHIDSYSLGYLRQKYSILVALISDDQYSTDNYRLWGGYLSGPYIPSKSNVLVPGQSAKDRIDIVVIRTPGHDLFNLYEGGGGSAYSLRIDNYLGARQNTDYFGKLIEQFSQKDFNEFTHVNMGLENNKSKTLFGQEIRNSYKKIEELKPGPELEFVTLQSMANFVLNRYPESSPVYFNRTKDPLGLKGGEVIWYQNSFYRLGLKTEDGQTRIIDFRAFNNNISEDNLSTPNIDPKLYLEIPAIVDTIKYPMTEIGLDIDLSSAKYTYENWRVYIEDKDKMIELNPRDITFKNFDPSINSKDITIEKRANQTKWNITPHTPYQPKANHLLFLFSIYIPLIIVAFIFNRSLAFGLIFSLITTFTVIRSGSLYPFGLGIWGPNGHDAIFHISLIEKFSQNPFNLSHPQIAGELLTNYHFVFDYISGLASRVFNLSPVTLYFVAYPIIISLSITFLLSSLFGKWKFGTVSSTLSYFFVFLSGSLGFITSLIQGRGMFLGESAFWANQSVSLLLNPPFALSLVVILLLLLLLEKYPHPKYSQLILIGFTGGLLAQVKIYAFILVCLALVLNKKIKELIAIGSVGFLITLPFTSISGSPFVFSPLWFTKSIFASPDRVWWQKFVQAWQAYEAGGVWVKLVAVNIIALTVFLLGNLSTRIAAFKYIFQKKLTLTENLALTISLLGIVIPLIVIQSVNPWNTIQFIYYSLFFLGVFAGPGIFLILKSIKSKLAVISIISLVLLATFATSIGTLWDYLGFYSSSRISNTELLALDKLKDQPSGIVLSPLFSKKLAGKVPTPKPLYGYVSTAYISAFSGQPEYLSDTINLDITGFNYTQKARDQQRFYQTSDQIWARNFLKTENISYVYETPLQRIKINPQDLCLSKIFDSGEINIYKFNCHGQN